MKNYILLGLSALILTACQNKPVQDVNFSLPAIPYSVDGEVYNTLEFKLPVIPYAK